MKQMKALFMAAFVFLAFVGVAYAATDAVEIRSSVLHYNKETTIGPAEWAGLYYDLNKGIGTEKLSVIFGEGTNVTIKYTTTTQQKGFEFSGWTDEYNVVGFFAEPYVAISKVGEPGKANKIAKLVLDSSDKFTLKTGEPLDLGYGYSLVPKQIDTDGNKVWLELLKDGQLVDDSIISVSDKSGVSKDWILEKTVLGDKDIQVFRVHVNQVFQGSDSLVEIKGLWLIDSTTAFEVKDDIDYGKFECKQASSSELIYTVEDLSLQADSVVNLGKDILLKTEKNFNKDDDRHDTFYFLKLYDAPGEYTIRGPTNTISLIPGNFAGFYYDIDDGFGTENLNGTVDESKHTILKEELIYSSTPQLKTFDYEKWGQYRVVDLFGKPYVPLQKVDSSNSKDEKLAHLLYDSNEKYTLKVGEALDLGSGYSLTAKQIDTDGNKVWLELQKDGVLIDNAIVSVNTNNTTWTLEKTVSGEKDTVIFRVQVNQVFQGTEASLVEIKGLWLIDATESNILTLTTDQTFGKFDYKGITNGSLIFKSNDDIVLSKDSEIALGGGFYIKVADNESLDFYIFAKKSIDGDSASATKSVTPISVQQTTVTAANVAPSEEEELELSDSITSDVTDYEENISDSTSYSNTSEQVNESQEQNISSINENKSGKKLGIILVLALACIGAYVYWSKQNHN